MRIAAAGPQEMAAWLALRAELWPDAPPQEQRREVEALLAAADAVAFIAWDAAATAAGFAEATLRHDHVNGCDTSPVAFLEGLYVAPAHRRRGVARTLLERVEAWARTQGVTELASDAEAGNAAGVATHAAFGFEETERVVFFRKLLPGAPVRASG